MANIYVSEIGVPRKPRNKRIYGGNSFVFTNVNESSSFEQRHIETGRIDNITDWDLTVYYQKVFEKVPVGVGKIDLYRFVDGATMGLPSGSYIKQDVLYYWPNSTAMLNLDSFNIIIDASEPLLGIKLEYIITD